MLLGDYGCHDFYNVKTFLGGKKFPALLYRDILCWMNLHNILSPHCLRQFAGLLYGGWSLQPAAARTNHQHIYYKSSDLLDLPQRPEHRTLYDAMDNAARNRGNCALDDLP